MYWARYVLCCVVLRACVCGHEMRAISFFISMKPSSLPYLLTYLLTYILNQVQRQVTVPGLAEVLRNTQEHRMVRHEAAEALGAIGGTEVEAILGEFRDDPELVVMESCEVALDTIEYWETEFAKGEDNGGMEEKE